LLVRRKMLNLKKLDRSLGGESSSVVKYWTSRRSRPHGSIA
jgi:hypothetical protein